jgi:hypothetical protein
VWWLRFVFETVQIWLVSTVSGLSCTHLSLYQRMTVLELLFPSFHH